MMTNKTETLNMDLDKKNMERRTLALFAAVSDQQNRFKSETL